MRTSELSGLAILRLSINYIAWKDKKTVSNMFYWNGKTNIIFFFNYCELFFNFFYSGTWNSRNLKFPWPMMVQRRAAKYVLGGYHNTSSVSDMMEQLQWSALAQRRCCLRLTISFDITDVGHPRVSSKAPKFQSSEVPGTSSSVVPKFRSFQVPGI